MNNKTQDNLELKKNYEAALELNPNDALTHYYYAILLNNNFHEYNEAKRHYEKTIELDLIMH